MVEHLVADDQIPRPRLRSVQCREIFQFFPFGTDPPQLRREDAHQSHRSQRMAVEINHIEPIQRRISRQHHRANRTARTDAERRNDADIGNRRDGRYGNQRDFRAAVAQQGSASPGRGEQKIGIQVNSRMLDTIYKRYGIEVRYRNYSVPHHHPYSFKIR